MERTRRILWIGATGAALFALSPIAGEVFAQPPPNDECLGAIPIPNGTSGPFSTGGSTTSSPVWPCGAGANDVWFTYTATCTGTALFSLCSGVPATFDTTLQVFDGSCGSLTPLLCNDDRCGLTSQGHLSVTSGTTYFIRVGGWEGATGSFTITVSCWAPAPASPVNDECSGAIALVDGVNDAPHSGGLGFNNFFATTSSPAWPCGPGVNDTWYTYTATCTGNATFSSCFGTSTVDTTLEVFSGSCASLTSLACNDNFCGGASQVTVPVTSGTTYKVRVGNPTAGFRLHVTCAPSGGPPNDECGGAIPVFEGKNGPFSSGGATQSSPPWACPQGPSGDVWFTYTAPCTGIAAFSTCPCGGWQSPWLGTGLEVFEGSCASLTSIACPPPPPVTCLGGAQASLPVTAGTTYKVRVSTGNALGANETGSFTLHVRCGGSFTTVGATACGGLDLTPSGAPVVGGFVQYTLSSGSPFRWLWVGLPVYVPLCPAGCALGASTDFFLMQGPVLSIHIPCDPALAGATVSVQGVELFVGGCLPGAPAGVAFRSSPTIDTTIG